MIEKGLIELSEPCNSCFERLDTCIILWRRQAVLLSYELADGPPNGFELTGAGLTPRCNDDRKEAGVRCSEGLDDAFIC